MIARYNYYIWALLIYLIALSGYVYTGYENERQALYSSIDKDLIQGASAVPLILTNGFHDKILNQNSISSDEDMLNIQKLSEFTKLTRLVYIYSFILDKEDVRFTSSSATPEELKTNDGLSHYFDEYDSATLILKDTFIKGVMNFEKITDKWGTFRSVYIPHKTPSGQVYVTCADMQIDFIEEKLHDILFYALLEALFYVVILFPFFIAFWFVNKKINIQLEETIRIRTQELAKSKEQVSLLLDNSEQGFLSFNSDFIIGDEYSKECIKLLGDNLGGKNIVDVLLHVKHEKELFIEAINDFVDQDDEVLQECILSLLPNEIILDKKALKIEYKMIGNNSIMLIITNITAQKTLENKIKTEQEILKMIVEIVSDSEIFFDTKREYEKFISSFKTYIDEHKTPRSNFNEIYRIIHTFKGAFSQLYMQKIVHVLHEIESRLSLMIQENHISNHELLKLLQESDFNTSLVQELETINSILGEDFLKETNYVKVDFQYLHELQEKVTYLMLKEDSQVFKYRDLFEKILNLSKSKLFNLLKPYNNLVNQLAQRLEKEIYPFEISGDYNITVKEEYKPFIKSLIHVFRNSIDHGIEDPETRVLNEKDERGTVRCNFEKKEQAIYIFISDDGAGIKKEKVLEKAVQKGLVTQADAKTMSEDEVFNFIFHNQFSTKEEISAISGRGVGMSAVKAELEKIGGKVEIKSEANLGTTFIFMLPYAET